MKKLIFIILLVLTIHPAAHAEKNAVRKALFISVIQEPWVLSSRAKIEEVVRFAKNHKIDTLFVQIYRANRAWFPSKIGDSTPYEFCMKQVGEDAFALLIREAHREGIEVHAWLNMLSLSRNEEAPLLKKYGPYILTRNLKEKKRLQDWQIDRQYFLEPGDPRLHRDFSKMVEEIVNRYPELDGLQFDYIRYPDENPDYGYTPANVERYKRSTGRRNVESESSSWKDWKRLQVTQLLETLIQKAKSIRPDLKVSSTGLMPYSRAYHEGLQDWKDWLRRGLIDFVTLMCYIRDEKHFDEYLEDAKIQTGSGFSKTNVAVGAYFFLAHPEKFDTQWKACAHSGSRACAVFHYGSLLEAPALQKSLEER